MCTGSDRGFYYSCLHSAAAGTTTDTAGTATECNSILITVIMGSLIGLLLLILIAAVILGTCICICLRVHTSRRKHEDTGEILVQVLKLRLSPVALQNLMHACGE